MAVRWVIKVEYERTPSTLAALKAKTTVLGLSLTEVERTSGATVLVTRPYRCDGPSDALMEAWSLTLKIQSEVGICQPAISVLIHAEKSPEPIPPVMSLSEVGLALGVSRQRAQQLSQQPKFPPPLARTSNGPIYAASDIYRYHELRERTNSRDKNGAVARPKVGPPSRAQP